MLLKSVVCWEVMLCWMSGSHSIHNSIMFSLTKTAFLDCLTVSWNSELQLAQHNFFFSHCCSIVLIHLPPPFLSNWHIHSSQLFQLSPELGSVPWKQRQYISPTHLNKPSLFLVGGGGNLRVSCELVTYKDIFVYRMYWLDKCVCVVAVMLLLWFGYHSTVLQSALSGVVTSVIGWYFQIRCTLHCCTLREVLPKSREFHTVDVGIEL
jgi:hypothetical protein